jgi:hypothetical protein
MGYNASTYVLQKHTEQQICMYVMCMYVGRYLT